MTLAIVVIGVFVAVVVVGTFLIQGAVYAALAAAAVIWIVFTVGVWLVALVVQPRRTWAELRKMWQEADPKRRAANRRPHYRRPRRHYQRRHYGGGDWD